MASLPECDLGSFNRVKFAGSNVGAAMFLRGGDLPEFPAAGCCCINIYVNSNVQGINSSLVMGSKIKMQDPGVHLYFGDLKWGTTTTSKSGTEEQLGYYLVSLLLALLFCLFIMLKL